MRTRAAKLDEVELSPHRWRLETQDPDDVPIAPPHEDPDDPDFLPDEEEEYPGEDDEYGSPAVEPHEEPLVAP
jgi:hypothetical protein